MGVSKHGVIQTPLPRKFIVLWDVSADEENNVLVAPEVIGYSLASWKEIVGLTLVDEDYILIVIRSQSNQVVTNSELIKFYF